MGVEEIRTALKKNDIVIGKDRVLKLLRKRKLAKVFLSSNISAKMEKDIKYYAKLVEIPVEKISLPNDELKVLCKKQFLISVLGIAK